MYFLENFTQEKNGKFNVPTLHKSKSVKDVIKKIGLNWYEENNKLTVYDKNFKSVEIERVFLKDIIIKNDRYIIVKNIIDTYTTIEIFDKRGKFLKSKVIKF